MNTKSGLLLVLPQFLAQLYLCNIISKIQVVYKR